jgi:hypothetical protein
MDRGDGEEIAHELVSCRETKEPRRVEEVGMGITITRYVPGVC